MKTTIQPLWHYRHSIHLLFFTRQTEGSRRRFIKAAKLPEEHSLRLRLLQKVKGELPADLTAAGDTLLRADAYYGNVSDNSDNLRLAQAARAHAWTIFNTVYADNLPAIEALHRVECPDCPWNGKTIFTRMGADGLWY